MLGSERYSTIVIKIGSSLLFDEGEEFRASWLKGVAQDIAGLQKLGKKIVIVASGAVSFGRKEVAKFGIVVDQKKLPVKQTLAAVGQVELINAYKRVLLEEGILCAQVLLTIDDSDNRQRYINSQETFDTILQSGIVAVVNENDTVATTALKIGDNDRLAARVCDMVGADLLVIMSDVAGLFDKNPNSHTDAKLIKSVDIIDESIESMAGDAVSKFGTGGMITKIIAAKMACGVGCYTIICSGKIENPIRRMFEDNECTTFKPSVNKDSCKKNWIKNYIGIPGSIAVDEGAYFAIKQGRSLLPIGIKEVSGNFMRGSIINIIDEQKNVIAKGISEYDSKDIALIAGLRSDKIEDALGFIYTEEVVHSNNLANI